MARVSRWVTSAVKDVRGLFRVNMGDPFKVSKCCVEDGLFTRPKALWCQGSKGTPTLSCICHVETRRADDMGAKGVRRNAGQVDMLGRQSHGRPIASLVRLFPWVLPS